MIGWLYRKLIGNFKVCTHKWVQVEQLTEKARGSSSLPTAYTYVLKCEHCGEMKFHRVG